MSSYREAISSGIDHEDLALVSLEELIGRHLVEVPLRASTSRQAPVRGRRRSRRMQRPQVPRTHVWSHGCERV
eukprot:25288-Eustigmatos_ZCMA.PRE.1